MTAKGDQRASAQVKFRPSRVHLHFEIQRVIKPIHSDHSEKPYLKQGTFNSPTINLWKSIHAELMLSTFWNILPYAKLSSSTLRTH
jgi:hypothetical protein